VKIKPVLTTERSIHLLNVFVTRYQADDFCDLLCSVDECVDSSFKHVGTSYLLILDTIVLLSQTSHSLETWYFRHPSYRSQDFIYFFIKELTLRVFKCHVSPLVSPLETKQLSKNVGNLIYFSISYEIW
jgi:hypothetical protein